MKHKLVFLLIVMHCITIQFLISQELDSIYLSDFVISKDKITYHDVGVGIDHVWNLPDKILTINGVEYEKGLGTMANWGSSYLEYELDSQFVKFTAIVGLDDQSLIKEDEFTYTFEWILVDTAGNVIRQYRGCGSVDKTSDVCDSVDNFVPYWPGNDDKDNEWVDFYINNTPDRRIMMTRPSCQARVLLDDSAVYNSGYITKSESYNSLADTIEIDLTGKNKLKLDIISDGIQYDPFEAPIMLKNCPWRDMLDWADAKLYYEKSVTGVEVTPEVIMDPKESGFINIDILPSNAKMTFYTLESLNPDVVIVTDVPTGRIWSVASGITKILVTTLDGNYTDTCVVKVTGDVTSSIKDNQLASNFFVKNPATADNIRFHFPAEGKLNMHIKIFDLSGKCVWERAHVNEKSISLNLSGKITEGLYIVSVRGENIFYTNKLIINK